MFRQIVYANGFRDGYVNAGVDIRTTFERRISRVYDDRTVIDFEVRSIEIWDGPRFLGVVDHLPGRLRRVRATVYRDGFVDFDRMIYVVGDLSRGFELVSLRYHGLGPNAAYVDLDVRVGVIDFRRREVQSVDYSRNLAWLDAGLVPSALIPQDDDSGLRFVLEGEGSRYAHTYTLGSLSNPNQGLETREITLSRID